MKIAQLASTVLLTLTISALAACQTSHTVHEDNGGGGGGPSDVVRDLVIVQSVSVEFGDVAADVAEETEIAFKDLRTESRYVDLVSELECAGLNTDESSIDFAVLDVDAEVVPFEYQIRVRPTPGADEEPDDVPWTLLAEFLGNVYEGETVALTDDRFTVLQEGLDVIADVALSEEPAYDAWVIGESGSDIGELTVDMYLQLEFSSDPLECP